MKPLDALEPSLIGKTFGRPGCWLLERRLPRAAKPSTRFVLFGVVTAMLILVVDNLLEGLVTHRHHSVLRYMLNPGPTIPRLDMPLLLDPVGLLMIVVSLATPYFCAKQVESIAEFVPTNAANMDPKALRALPADRICALVRWANRWFGRIGDWRGSLGIAVGSAALAGFLWYALQHWGLMRSWNPTSRPRDAWRHAVLQGWWAHWDEHRVMSIVLFGLAWFLFYFLGKQLLMGLVFAIFAKRAQDAGFGVTPNLDYDSDGYHGLRQLRRFMQWTYGSSLAHFVLTVGVGLVWLPITTATLFIGLLILAANVTVVIFPSTVAFGSALDARRRRAREIYARTYLAPEDRRSMIAELWEDSILPFRLRSSFTAVTLYLLVPLILALVSALVGK